MMSVKRRTQLMLEPEQHDRLQALAEAESTSVSDLVRKAIDRFLRQRQPLPVSKDPIWEVVGIGEGEKELIDGIPVSEDPDLYYLADLMARKEIGPYATLRDGPVHAWEIAPQRYTQGPDGSVVRVGEDEG
jgi:predicted DNA-binding protein